MTARRSTEKLKREITIVEFKRFCEANRSSGFCYNSSDNGGAGVCRVSAVFPAPSVFPNIRTICFKSSSGTMLVLTGVRKIVMTNAESSNEYTFECSLNGITSTVCLRELKSFVTGIDNHKAV